MNKLKNTVQNVGAIIIIIIVIIIIITIKFV